MKVSDMTNDKLDYWVAKAQGFLETKNRHYWEDGASLIPKDEYTPSTDWQQAGELVEKFKISLEPVPNLWLAEVYPYANECYPAKADTATRAICMAVIAAKFGYEVEDE